MTINSMIKKCHVLLAQPAQLIPNILITKLSIVLKTSGLSAQAGLAISASLYFLFSPVWLFAKPAFQLTYSISGGLAPTFEVEIANGFITYRTRASRNPKVEEVKRKISEKEIETLQQFIAAENLMNLASQDFTKEVLYPDQGVFSANMNVDGKTHTLSCGFTPSLETATNPCQKALKKMKDLLNRVL